MYLDALDGQPGGDVLEGTGHHAGGGEDVHRVAQRLAECVPDAVPRARAKPVLEDAGMLPSVGADAEWVSTASRVCNSPVARGPIELSESQSFVCSVVVLVWITLSCLN